MNHHQDDDVKPVTCVQAQLDHFCKIFSFGMMVVTELKLCLTLFKMSSVCPCPEMCLLFMCGCISLLGGSLGGWVEGN